ncbi:MAG: aminoacyl-tRNA hydrolase [Acidobacteriales bacterium]|nr:aminoacyl-tRNA hydrolase [Terriglobales bacterium]
MKLIVGLGNPGIEYQFTPHNMGFLAIDRVASEYGIEVRNRHCRALTGRGLVESEAVLLAKPETFMNLSGIAVRELVAEHAIATEKDLIVIHDELDFPLGSVRIHKRRGPAGHHGVESVIGALGTQDFLRIRLGVSPDRKVTDGMGYLLSPFPKSRWPTVSEELDVAWYAVKAILTEGPAAAMNRFNRKNEDEIE